MGNVRGRLAPAFGVVLLLAGSPAPPRHAIAQEAASRATKDEDARALALARFLEAFRAADWEKADAAFVELVREFPEYAESAPHLMKAAVARLKLGRAAKRAEAERTLEAVLAREPARGEALFL